MHEEAENKKSGLTRSLSSFNLIMMGIGAIIGAGIFVLTGQAAANYAGPAVTLSFVFASIVCIFAALCYAEFSSLVPVAGGPYSYAYVTLGEFAAWTIGWALTMEFFGAACTVAVAWSGYVSSLLHDLGLSLPMIFSKPPLVYDAVTGWARSGSIINVPAMAIIAFIGTMTAIGIKTAARLNDILVYIKFGVIVLFIGVGLFFIRAENLTPFIPENTGDFGEFGWSGILRGAGIVFFAFLGFDALSTLAQEAKNPQRDLPIGMIGSLSISAITYIVIALVLTGIVSFKLLGGEAPFAVAIDALGPNFFWMRYVAKCAIIAGLTSVVLVMFISQTRVFYTMSHDGLLPKVFSKVHHKLHTPFHNAMIFTVVGVVVSGIFPVDVLGALVSMGALMAFAIVCLGVLILRYTQPKLHRPFKVPLGPLIPALGFLIVLLQMVVLPGVIWIQTVAWLILGYIIYFTYSARRSKIRRG